MIEETKQYWFKESKGIYHELISCIISQRIPFSESRNIRKNLYSLLNSYTFTHNINNFSDQELKNTGLKQQTINIIRNIPENITLDNAKNIVGVGTWTIKCLKIRCYPNLYPDISLEEDYYIRKNIGLLLGRKVTQKEAREWYNQYPGKKTLVTLFMWRIKQSGIQKIINDQELNEEDFL